MKILIIHSAYTQYGGEDAIVKQEASFLKQNHEVSTLYFQNKKGLKGLFQFLVSIWNLRIASVVRIKINQFKPDIIHIHNWHFASGPIIIRVAKKKGVLILNTLHNYRLICPSGILLHKNQLFLDSLNQKFPWSAIAKKVYKNSMFLTFWLAFVVWFHKKIGTWQMVDKYICLTASAIKLFSKSWMGEIEYKFTSKPNFSNKVKAIEPQNIMREDHYLFIGRLSEEKGIKLLIDAFKKSTFKLKIAGSGPLKNYVVNASNQNDNISYIGVLNKEAVSLELNKANALIFSSICYETFGLVIIEAFSNSCAVISTNIGAPNSIVDDCVNGFCFKANNVDSLKETIKKWNTLPLLKKELIRANALKTYKEKFSPENQHQYFKNIYEKAP